MVIPETMSGFSVTLIAVLLCQPLVLAAQPPLQRKVAAAPPKCWTPWFDRDNPSGTGDWETLKDLRKGYPGKICDKPLQIQVQTTSGASVASTGNVIAVSDTNTGFVCKNRDQTKGMCKDFRVRFLCPDTFCTTPPPKCWTPWFDRDNPSGTGDWETLKDLRKGYPGKICDKPLQIQVQTTSGASVASTGNVIAVSDTNTGFVCKNRDQTKGMCKDFRVRFLCPDTFCTTPPPKCWTPWFDRDNPSGTGDWETLKDLRKGYPGKICDKPLQIQVQTTSGASVASTGNVIAVSDTNTGFVCKNRDQTKGMCKDFRVRFLCPDTFCTTPPPKCWTPWFDRDNPSGTGDWETLKDLRKGYPGKICDKPLQIQVQTTSGASVASTGNVIAVSDTNTGFVCKNRDQTKGMCKDFRVRFLCPDTFCTTPPPKCWTPWFDRDNPSGTGDWETLKDLRKGYPGKICDKPLQIQVQTTSGASVASTGNVIAVSDTNTGFVCKNRDQTKGMCKDFRVRFLCPDTFCTTPPPKCWTPWFDRDNPSGTGDWETLKDLRKGYPGKICDKPLQIQVQTTSGASVASTGNVIAVSDTNTGFVCKNRDQTKGMCKDFRVRFLCPDTFCTTPPPKCWTPWFDRDNPSGTGDWETLKDLRKGYPGKICDKPLQIQVQTTSGASVASTGNVIAVSDTNTGFVCKNRDQTKGMCKDFRVRFLCPDTFCTTPPPKCWTPWFDRDNPSGTGDWETLKDLRKGYPGKICDKPLQIQVQTTSGASVASTGNVIAVSDTNTGFVCKNRDQTKGMCKDFRVRFLCPDTFCTTPPPKCWTPWFDRDNPSGTGDWETLKDLRKGYPGKICDKPLQIQVQTTSGASVASTGNVIAVSDTNTGFVCKNRDQTKGMCKDFRVRFLCPDTFCTTPPPKCWTPWFDRDNPSGTGDWETLKDLRKGYPGKICDKPLQIQVQTTSGASVASTGNVIAVSDTNTGFVCKNRDQTKGMCKDFRVRFLCPDKFCTQQVNCLFAAIKNR